MSQYVCRFSCPFGLIQYLNSNAVECASSPTSDQVSTLGVVNFMIDNWFHELNTSSTTHLPASSLGVWQLRPAKHTTHVHAGAPKPLPQATPPPAPAPRRR